MFLMGGKSDFFWCWRLGNLEKLNWMLGCFCFSLVVFCVFWGLGGWKIGSFDLGTWQFGDLVILAIW
jgi:hypothetical protein